MEYFSSSKGSKNALVTPTFASKRLLELRLIEDELILTAVFCLLIIKLEFDVFRIETFFFGNFEYMLALDKFLNLGTFILNVPPLSAATADPFIPVTF